MRTGHGPLLHDWLIRDLPRCLRAQAGIDLNATDVREVLIPWLEDCVKDGIHRFVQGRRLTANHEINLAYGSWAEFEESYSLATTKPQNRKDGTDDGT